ncbi:MAG TPA: radical SAM protein [Kangiella sp.]
MELVDGFSKNEVLSSFSSKVLELIINPTEQCNFRCTYCYEDFEIQRMSPEIVQGIKNLLTKRIPTLKKLSFSWFGGEPLIEQGVVFEITKHAYDLCKEHGVYISGGFTTNGYNLTPELLKRLCDLNQNSYQITLDGSEETHNITRISRGGKGTFKKIWKNLLNIRDSGIEDFTVTIRIHLTIHNYDSVHKLVRNVKKEFGGDKRFNIHFHKISDLGGPNKVDVLSYDVYQSRLKELNKILEDEIESDNEYEKAGGINYICYASKPNSILIRANGRLAKCTVAFSDPRNDLGKILPDGKLDIDNKKLKPWLGGFKDMDKQYLGCPVSKLHEFKYENQIEAVEIE